MSESFNKGDLSEQDIITKYVLPAIERAGWDVAVAAHAADSHARPPY